MLKALFMLDCDECHEALTRAAVVSEQYEDEDLMTYTWQEAAEVLMCWAADAGWEFFNHIHICRGCLIENPELSAASPDDEFSSITD